MSTCVLLNSFKQVREKQLKREHTKILSLCT